MKTEDRIEREVEAILSLLERKTLLTARPNFNARLQARIGQDRAGARRGFAALFRLRILAPAAVTAMLVLNVVTAVLVFRKSDSGAEIRQKEMAMLAEEYELGSSSISSYWK